MPNAVPLCQSTFMSMRPDDSGASHVRVGFHDDVTNPDNPRQAQNRKVHHVAFGVALKKMMDELGVEAHLQYPGVKGKYGSREAFLIEKLWSESTSAGRTFCCTPAAVTNG